MQSLYKKTFYNFFCNCFDFFFFSLIRVGDRGQRGFNNDTYIEGRCWRSKNKPKRTDGKKDKEQLEYLILKYYLILFDIYMRSL